MINNYAKSYKPEQRSNLEVCFLWTMVCDGNAKIESYAFLTGNFGNGVAGLYSQVTNRCDILFRCMGGMPVDGYGGWRMDSKGRQGRQGRQGGMGCGGSGAGMNGGRVKS